MSVKKKTQFLDNNSLISKSAQESSFRAVKNLLEAEKNIETVKNRIKVLQLNEEKNLNKINIQKEQIEKLTMVKNEHLQQLRKLRVSKIERERILAEIKGRNQEMKKQHQAKIEAVKQEIQEEKAKDYTTTIEMRELNQSRILQAKVNTLQKKQQNRDLIVQNEQKSRENVVKFYEDKTKSIHQKTLQQINKINKTRQKYEKKLNEFSKIQMEMIERHSQSQVAYKQMKNKLDTMLGKIRSQKRKGLKEMKSSIHREGKQNMYALDNL